MSEIRVSIGDYDFYCFREDKKEVKVTCIARWIIAPLMKIGEPQFKEIKEILTDMGKWEALSKLVSDLRGKAAIQPYFGYDLYDIGLINPEERSVLVSFRLKPEASLRRTKGKDERCELSTEEIENQVKNITKWVNAKNAVTTIKGCVGYHNQ